jgi:short-subunit dehydrogenase involved in D-alanine esterification of teichoic acids
MASNKTVIVTGASQGIGAAVVQAFLGRGYNVVATSRSVSKAGFAPSPNLALVDGDIGQAATAANIAQTAIRKFGSIDSLVNNAGAFLVKPFMDYTAEDFRSLVSTNLEGFFFITQLAVKQMLSQGTGGSVTSITASLAQHPIAGLPASISMLTKGGLNAITVSLCERVREKQHPLQRGRAGRGRHPDCQRDPERLPDDPFADGHDFGGEGYRGCGDLSDGSSPCNRRSAARGWRHACRQMVAEVCGRTPPTTGNGAMFIGRPGPDTR